VTFGREDLVRRCLASLGEALLEGSKLRVFVVDNASGDGTPEMVAREFPSVNLTTNSDNLGFAKATNQAVRQGLAPYVLVLNPDARIGPKTLDPLLAVLAVRPDVAAVGPSLLREDGSADHAARRSFPTVRGALTYFSGLDRLVPGLRQYAVADQSPAEVDAINGAFMLIRREALEAAGLFDEGYWMYMEDLDLCRQLWQDGWKVRFEPASVAWHDKGGSAGTVRSPRLNYAFHYGMHRFYRKWEAPGRPTPFNLAVYAGIYLKLAVSILRGVVTKGLMR